MMLLSIFLSILACGPEPTLSSTCGDPACAGYSGPTEGVPTCAEEGLVEGDVCTEEGSVCDLEDDCNRQLICSTDYSADECPVSKAKYKRNIEYIDSAKSQSLADDLYNMKIAEWQYTKEAADHKEHLGFIIDDNPNSPAVRANGEQVDLYGYTSMAVVAIQQQQAQIQRLEKRIAELEKQLEKR